MSDERHPPVGNLKKEFSDTLDDILNFGPEDAPSSANIVNRINELVRKIQEINRRIDHLSTRL